MGPSRVHKEPKNRIAGSYTFLLYPLCLPLSLSVSLFLFLSFSSFRPSLSLLLSLSLSLSCHQPIERQDTLHTQTHTYTHIYTHTYTHKRHSHTGQVINCTRVTSGKTVAPWLIPSMTCLSIRPRDSNDHTLTSKWTRIALMDTGWANRKKGYSGRVSCFDWRPACDQQNRSHFLSLSLSLSLSPSLLQLEAGAAVLFSRLLSSLSWLHLSLSDYNTTDGGKKQSESEMQHESSCLDCTILLTLFSIGVSLLKSNHQTRLGQSETWVLAVGCLFFLYSDSASLWLCLRLPPSHSFTLFLVSLCIKGHSNGNQLILLHWLFVSLSIHSVDSIQVHQFPLLLDHSLCFIYHVLHATSRSLPRSSPRKAQVI